MTIPKTMQPKYDTIAELLSLACKTHMTEEYETLCLKLCSDLCQKTPSPLLKGREKSWAAGILFTIVYINPPLHEGESDSFSYDKLASAFSCSSQTARQKSREIRNLFKLEQSVEKWTLPSRLKKNKIVKFPDQKKKIYQVKITLKHSKPPIWRRLLIPGKITFYELHLILQESFGWYDLHLFQFFTNNGTIRMQDDFDFYSDLELEDLDASEEIVDYVLESEKKIIYEYDFGDGWEHQITLEKILEPDPACSYPCCLAGKMRGPLEDVGGIWGYYDFLDIINNPEHPDYNSMREWAFIQKEEEFDPEEFDPNTLNKLLVSVFDENN